MKAARDTVVFVGPRYSHHAAHSGYEAFGRYVGTPATSPVGFRWASGLPGRALNRIVAGLTRHAWYSPGALLTELYTLWHMLVHRNRLYHVLYGDSDLWLLRRAHRIMGHRLVASFHQPPQDLADLEVLDGVVRDLDGVILVSETQRPFFAKFLPGEKIFVVPHGVDTGFFRIAEVPRRSTPSCVALGSHLRDFETLAAAARLVWKADPRVRFTLVGAERDGDPALRGMEDDRVRFLNGLTDDELLGVLQNSDVAVFSFKSATANNALLESMAAGLPAVITDTGGVREYVPDGAGVFVPPGDPRAMAEGLVRILADPDSATRMGRISRERAEQLDFRVIAERMRRVYTDVLRAAS